MISMHINRYAADAGFIAGRMKLMHKSKEPEHLAAGASNDV